MTLAQLRYTIAIAKAGSMNEAAKSLYISQPSLSTAIREPVSYTHLTLPTIA